MIKYLLFFFLLFPISTFAFEDSCASYVTNSQTAYESYISVKNGHEKRMQELEYIIGEKRKLYTNIEQEILKQYEGKGVSGKYISTKIYQTQKDMAIDIDVYVNEYNIYVQNIESYRVAYNMSLKDVYACRYNVMKQILEYVTNTPGLTNKQVYAYYTQARYYADSEKAKSTLDEAINNLRNEITAEVPIAQKSIKNTTIRKTPKKQNVTKKLK